jgi:predicted hotdog family 3-hydroxylacyl-ACP dehydratase
MVPACSLEELLPHSGPMILIDEALDGGEGWAAAAVRVGEDSLFYQAGLGVPAWVGIEYMAQTVALYSGICAKRAGTDIRLGFLLGTRRYQTATNYFRLGSLLKISVHEVWQDGNMAVFDCQICYHEDAQQLAGARLNFFCPEDPVAFLREQA